MNTPVAHNTSSGESTPAIDWKVVLRFAIIALLIPLVLFITAGRIDWWQAWMYTILTVVVSLVSRYILYLQNPDLIAERARFTQSEGMKDWDKGIVILIAIVGPLAFMITAGLDKRFGWSAEVALPVQLGALIVFLLGYAFSTWALIVNKYFSSVVRIQTDRGHTVVTAGPYRLVRHPGYSGGIVAWLASPFLLGALWSFVPVALVILLYIVRTALEDRTLQNELPGYKEYAQRVRYRLLPGIW
ncbi:MAG: isoprenylcysteine carboxylmethyltransferase family protein [Anaerolineae bacterium]|nr:isoprenylcysteine carboxylmethyltransferase family protein [Anaerolineae bacterium]